MNDKLEQDVALAASLGVLTYGSATKNAIHALCNAVREQSKTSMANELAEALSVYAAYEYAPHFGKRPLNSAAEVLIKYESAAPTREDG
jgi:hypothetical protein